ncbi:hypothetical protein [Muricauda sp. MAR_2010_75]|uniref:beta strand repeat-containing protein n=1 Tax=Allomuricauda sp. MAR_2010_75 TaxID=1250232 RepID=UPI00056A85C6|nr:hypothetical protein [Muricauda sp. MAR_2010_75]
MKKSVIALILLLSSGIAFSQTTVTLQDQCNCEVLKGTAVSSPGANTPNGVDMGDIYVNTNTGTIYFWDGDSWELTSADDQQLTGFTFDGATNTLALTLENGGSVNVDLSSLSDALTDTNTTITSFGIDATNTNLVITDSDTNTYAVALADLAALIDTDTTLTDAQVATAVNNEFPNLDTDATDDFSGDFNDLTNLPANLDTDSTDDFDGEWSSLNNVPAGFADNIDNDTQLTDAQVATAVNNEFPNLDTDATDDFSGDFNDLANLPANLDTDSTDDFDGEWSSLANVPAGFADNIDNDTQLTDAQVATAVNNEFPNLDTDSTDDFDGEWSSLANVPAGFADNVDNVDDADSDPANELQAITSTDGTVTVTPNGNDFDLSGFSGDFGDLTNVPANLDTDSTDDFDGEWSSLANVPAGFADDIDNVDDADSDPANELQAITSIDGTVTITPNGNDFDLSGFSGDFGDLSNLPANLDTDSTDDFDGEWSSLANVPAGFADNIDNDTQLTDAQVATAVNNEFPNLDTDATDDFSGDFNDLTNLPANLDTDSTDDFDGEWSSLANVPAGFADDIDNVDDADSDPANELQAITSTDGTVTVTPNGNDFDLSGFSGDFADLTNVPANLDTDSTDDFDGEWSSLANVPAGFADNVDNVDDADAIVGNEYNTGSSITDGVIGITDGGGTEQIDLISSDANNDISFGTDGALYLNVASVTIAETITNLVDNNDGTVTYTNENGAPQTVNKSSITDNLDGTYTFDNGNGSPVTFIGTDNDTQLTDAQVATAVNNEFPNLDTDATDDFSGDFNDLTNLPANLDTDSTDDFDGEWSSLANVPAGFADNVDNDTQLTDAQVATAVNNEFPNLDTDATDDFSGDFNDLTNLPANLDTDSTDDFDGEWSSLANVPAGFADDIDNVDDADSDPANELQAITSTDGTVTVTPNGNDFDLSGFSGDFGDLTNVPANLDTDSTDDFDGEWSSLANVPAGFADNIDNDTQLTDAQVATAVNNEFPNLDTDATDDFSGDFNDLTNLPANLDTDSTDDFDGEWSSLANVPAGFADNIDNDTQLTDAQVATAVNNEFPNLDTDATDDFSGDFNDLTNLPANLDTDSTDDFDGEWSSLANVPAGFADNVDNVDDADSDPANELQAITSTDGTVTVTPNGNDFDLSGFSGDFADLTNVPANLDTDSTDDFDGEWSSLANVPAGFADNVDNVDDADAIVGNEYNTGSSITDGVIGITDGGGTEQIDLISSDANNDISFGTDGALYLNVASVTIAETITNLVDNNDGTVTYTNENGAPQTVNKSSITDNLDGTYTFDNGNGSPVTFIGTDNDTQLTDAQVATAVNNEFPNLDTNSTDDFDGEWSSLANVPAGFADNIDNDTQLTDAQVATAVNNEFPNLDTDATDDFSGDFNDLTNLPANLDTDSTDDFDGEWSSLANVPAGFADNIDNDTQLTDAQVATAVNNEFPNLDTDVTDDFSGDFNDLTNLPANLDTDSTDDFDGEWSSLANVPAGFSDNVDNVDDADNDPANELQAITSTDGTVTVTPNGNDFDLSGFSGDFGDLTNLPANLDTDSTDDFDGEWSSLANVPAGFADNVDNVDDADSDPANELQAITSTDGTVTVTPNGNDFDLSGFSGDFGDLSNVPANLDTDSTDDFDGEWSSLANVPAGFADNIDNDTQLTDAQVATAVNNEFPNLDTDVTDDFSGDFNDLTNLPANLDTDSTDDFDGEWSSLANVPAGFSDNVDNVDDADNDPANELQAITSTDGTVTVTPNGNDFDLSGFSGDFGDLTNLPANLDTDSTDDFDGEWSSLANVPAGFADNVDNVDDADSDPANELQAITSTDGTVTVTPNGNDFDLSGFSGDFGDLSNVPANLDTDSTDDFDGEWSSLANVPAGFADNIDNDTQLTDAQVATAVNNEFPNLDTDVTDDFSGDFNDLSNLPANLDTDSTDDFDGEWSSLANVPAGFADDIDNVDDADSDPANELQAITSTDGTVTVTPNGNDFDLSGFSGDFADLTNVPANLDTDSTDDFDGEWSSLANVPAGFADNIDNDTQLTDAQVATAVNNEFPNLDTDVTDDFSGDFNDLSNLPANLDTDSTDDFDGEWSSLANVPAGFADDIDNVDDADSDPANELQAITSTDGTVTVTPNGNDFDLSGFSGDFGDLTNVPANLDTDSTDDFDGEWSSLANVPAGFADNIDNDTQLTDAQVATAVNNEFPNLDTDATDDFSGDFGDLSNVPANLDTDSTDDFDGEWSSLNNVPAGFADNIDNDTQLTDAQVATAVNNEFPNLDTDATDDFSGDFNDLANLPANLDTDSTDDFDGEWSSLANVPAGFADNVDNVDDADSDPANELQAITSTDGTVTVTPNGNDFDLSGFSGDFGDLSNVPANLDTDSTDDFDGEWSSLANVPAGFADNIDNDTQLTDAQVATAVNNEFPNLDTDVTDDFSGDFNDLTNLPANLDTDSTDDFDGEWSSLANVPAGFADNVDNVDDADAIVGNEYNTNFTVTGGNLRITDGGGDLDVPLSSIDTDDQTASEVNSDSPVDVDGDGNTEATVEDVIQDIAPITSKAARIFYPPSIAIDASTNGIGRTVDLYAQYVAQYGTPSVASAGAPAAIPTYAATDLYYYITYADPTVFANMSIDANGELTYDIIGQPGDYNALINVVFVVK